MKRGPYQQAMMLAGRGSIALARYDFDAASRLYGEAATLAEQAVPSAAGPLTRAIYLRSAAWCAFKAGRLSDARRLARQGLDAPECYEAGQFHDVLRACREHEFRQCAHAWLTRKPS